MEDLPLEDLTSPAAQRRLYERLRPRVAGFLQSRGLPPESVRELTQETFLRVFEKVGTLKSMAALDPWVLRIAANLWKNELRAQAANKRSAKVLSLDEELEGGADRFERSLLSGPGTDDPLRGRLEAERAEIVRGCVEQLPPRMRSCLAMHYYQDRRQEEIAILLQISAQSVKSHIHTAKQRVRDCAHERLQGAAP